MAASSMAVLTPAMYMAASLPVRPHASGTPGLRWMQHDTVSEQVASAYASRRLAVPVALLEQPSARVAKRHIREAWVFCFRMLGLKNTALLHASITLHR